MRLKKDVTCPYCGGQKFLVENLGNPATVWRVTFGSRFFRKRELHACACEQCGFVSLFIDVAPEVSSSERAD